MKSFTLSEMALQKPLQKTKTSDFSTIKQLTTLSTNELQLKKSKWRGLDWKRKIESVKRKMLRTSMKQISELAEEELLL